MIVSIVVVVELFNCNGYHQNISAPNFSYYGSQLSSDWVLGGTNIYYWLVWTQLPGKNSRIENNNIVSTIWIPGLPSLFVYFVLQVSWYIAEWWNTVSNMSLIVPALYGIIQARRYRLELRLEHEDSWWWCRENKSFPGLKKWLHYPLNFTTHSAAALNLLFPIISKVVVRSIAFLGRVHSFISQPMARWWFIQCLRLSRQV